MGGKTNRKVNIPMCAALILLCLVLVSSHLTSGLYARYTSSSTGSDSARVAKFEVETSGADENISVTADNSGSNNGTYIITIENKSEVAVSYNVSYQLTPVLGDSPAGVSAALDSNTGELAAGAAPVTHTLTLSVDWAAFTQGQTGANVSKDISFTVNIHFEQID